MNIFLTNWNLIFQGTPAINVNFTTPNASNTQHQSGTWFIPLNSSVSSENSSSKRDIEESI
ncbi:10066_t:CDS:2 [Funneliformis geosporum]|uniref:10066_t:CDS:1 n=1 Tax=Funneliformis geosporum TaxID=1117311 RepID=A0A9W4SJ05_9GLOM|nr:10066_t:CDS:2 [Funneliformis geosporum]